MINSKNNDEQNTIDHELDKALLLESLMHVVSDPQHFDRFSKNLKTIHVDTVFVNSVQRPYDVVGYFYDSVSTDLKLYKYDASEKILYLYLLIYQYKLKFGLKFEMAMILKEILYLFNNSKRSSSEINTMTYPILFNLENFETSHSFEFYRDNSDVPEFYKEVVPYVLFDIIDRGCSGLSGLDNYVTLFDNDPNVSDINALRNRTVDFLKNRINNNNLSNPLPF